MPVRHTRRAIRSLVVTTLATLLLPAVSFAQVGGAANADVTSARAGVAAMGKQWNTEVNRETARLYVALHRQRDSSGIRRIPDVNYGPRVREKLDLFVPTQGFDQLGPVIVYLHGGESTGGDKIVTGTDDLLYSNVAKWAARVGGVGVNANYQPSGTDDIRRLIDWVRRNAAQYGGDRSSRVGPESPVPF